MMANISLQDGSRRQKRGAKDRLKCSLVGPFGRAPAGTRNVLVKL